MPTTPMSRRLITLTLGLLLIPIGIAWRTAPLHLPTAAYKWGGSLLWAAMVYWLLATFLPRWSPWRTAALAAVVAAAVEASRLFHTPGFDAFRLTLAGKLLLGRVFSLRNITAYWLAVGLSATLDFAAFFRPTPDGTTVPFPVPNRLN